MKATLIHFPKILWLPLVVLSTSLCGQSLFWTQTSAPTTNWSSVAWSTNGSKLVAAVSGGGIYTSDNWGATWTPTSAPATNNWRCVASSSDGTVLLAAVSGGRIYISRNSGATWTQTGAPTTNWSSVASSASGTVLVAVIAGGGIYHSFNWGSTWTKATAPTTNWTSVASSANGTKLVAAVSGGGIYTSGNAGGTWSQTDAPTTNNWRCVASSSDGTKLVAAVFGGGIYTARNSGATWTRTSAPTRNWASVASSANGTNLAAAVSGGEIYTSGNAGATWAPTSVPNTNWKSVASSADGTKLVAVVGGGGIYTDIMPVITQQPESALSCPGTSPTIEIAAGGLPSLGFRWRKNETNLVDVGNVTGSGTPALTLLNVTQTDTANYDVVVTNAYGSVTSSVATLTVTRIPARATPIEVNGFIIGAVLLDGGCGYSSPPAITFSGQGGSGAVAYAQISDGAVTNIGFASAGIGYPTNTLLLIAPPVYPVLDIVQSPLDLPPATATPIITNGFVIGANLIAGGSDYPEAPTVSFSDVSGQGASAYAQITNGSVVSIVISDAGLGYSTNTVLSISAPPTFIGVIPSATGLMAMQTYQLNVANNLNHWTNYGSPFVATNTAWTATDHWNVTMTNRTFFRLQLFQ